jgi:hypothetical protein
VLRFFTAEDMNRVSDVLAYSHHDIAHAVGETSEMVDGGYIAELTAAQIAVLEAHLLPAGRPVSAGQTP